MTNKLLLVAYKVARQDTLAVALAIQAFRPMKSAFFERFYNRRKRQAEKLYQRLMERI